MLICIDLLPVEQLAEIEQALERTIFQNGRKTAGWFAQDVKHNLQAVGEDPAAQQIKEMVLGALERNLLVKLAARPRRIGPIILSRYQAGMAYGGHTDDAIMAGDPPLRTDVSFTVFLSGPDDYEGGALVLDSTAGECSYRLPAGSVVLYPASTLHRVEPVTQGMRQVAVGWIQSFIRDPAQRELLFDLDTLRRQLHKREGKTAEFDVLSKSVSNLLRMWAEI